MYVAADKNHEAQFSRCAFQWYFRARNTVYGAGVTLTESMTTDGSKPMQTLRCPT